MRTNAKFTALIALSLLSAAALCSYTTLKHQDEHFINLSTKNYVLVIFANLKTQPKLAKPISKVLSRLSSSKTVKAEKVLLELADTNAVSFFDSHYDLEGKAGLRLFIRSQMLKNEELAAEIGALDSKGADEHATADRIEKWLTESLARISTHITSLEQMKALVAEKKIVGLYSGSRGSNFEEHFRVARKHIDFTFAHTFDSELAAAIYAAFGSLPFPKDDTFAVIRDAEALTEFDALPIVTFAHFNERELTEFLEFERYAKLRSSAETASIYSKLFHKHQPLLLFTGAPDSSPEHFHAFTEAIKQLPKNMIYGHTDIESVEAGAFHRLFMQAKEALTPGSVNIVHAGVDKKINIEQLTGKLSAARIASFATDFMRNKKEYFRSIRGFLYDKVEEVKERIVGEHGEEEKKDVTDSEL